MSSSSNCNATRQDVDVWTGGVYTFDDLACSSTTPVYEAYGPCTSVAHSTLRFGEPKRFRQYYPIDHIRGIDSKSKPVDAGTALAAMKQMQARFSSESVSILNAVDPIGQSLKLGVNFPCPWPSTSPCHQSDVIRSLSLSVSLEGTPGVDLRSLREILATGAERKALTFDISGKSVAGLLKATNAEGKVNSLAWNDKSGYHGFVDLIQVTRLESSLPGAWHMWLSSSRPVTRRESLYGATYSSSSSGVTGRQNWYSPSALGVLATPSTGTGTGGTDVDASNPVGRPLRFPVYQTQLGGQRINQPLYRMDTDEYQSPEFSRWMNVDLEPLRAEVAAAARAFDVHPQRDTWADSMRKRLGAPVYAGGVCVIQLPTSFADLYNTNRVNLVYLVMTEMSRIYQLERGAYLKSRTKESDPPLTHEAVLMDLVVQQDIRFLFLRRSTLDTLLDEKHQRFDRNCSLMRFDDLKLHLAPVDTQGDGSGWAQQHKAAEMAHATTTRETLRSMAPFRFNANIAIVYEPLFNSGVHSKLTTC